MKYQTKTNRISKPKLDTQATATTKSKVQKAMMAECDINVIMKKYFKTGKLPEMIKSNPRYGDFSQLPQYQDSMNVIALAVEQFEALPAALRKKLGNDPAQLFDYIADPSNAKELIKLGLATPKPVVKNEKTETKTTLVNEGSQAPAGGSPVAKQ